MYCSHLATQKKISTEQSQLDVGIKVAAFPAKRDSTLIVRNNAIQTCELFDAPRINANWKYALDPKFL